MCAGHLKDPGFASPQGDSAEAAKKKQLQELKQREIDLVIKEYEEKQRKKKSQKKGKDKTKDKESKESEQSDQEDKDARTERDQKVWQTPFASLQKMSFTSFLDTISGERHTRTSQYRGK